MAKNSLAQPPRPIPAPKTTELEHVDSIIPRALRLSGRIGRGIELHRDRASEIERVGIHTYRAN